MNEIKKIQYNCKQATFLIEKKQITSLSLQEKFKLKIHLYGCSVCRIFQQQSIIINQMVKTVLNSKEHMLDEKFKSALQKKIEEKLKV